VHTSVTATTVHGFPPKSIGSNGLLVGFTSEELARPRWRIREGDIPDVYMTFVLKWLYFDLLHRAVDKLSDEVIKRIIPNDPNEFVNDSCLDQPVGLYLSSDFPYLQLDKRSQQFDALRVILAYDARKAPVLITGSFGTGKTRLLARAAYQILNNHRRSRVLICCHHGRSADSFIEKYFGPMYRNGYRIAAVRVISNNYHNVPHGWEDFFVRVRDVKHLNRDQCPLVVTTFNTAINLMFKFHGFFTHILLDEGAQTREPENIAPLCLANENTKIVIAGDHKQVGPALLVLGDSTVDKLKISLLERLHSLYNSDELTNYSTTHCISLYTNFRCHHALLSLPSYLFYDSMLMTAAESVTHLHPDVKYPLHFICSSFREEVEKVTESATYPLEADLLLDEAVKYMKNWPSKQWGNKDLRNICLMAATQNQKNLLVKLVKFGKYKQSLRNIEILTAFDIQGREFEAIFLSTSEPLEADYTPRNITKSPCSPYVFNTALTRAKSLVVCAGNPFVLMETEKQMNKDSSCWKDYIRRCVTCKTFVVPQKVLDEDALKKEDVHCRIQDIIFSPISFSSVIEPTPQKDTILKSLQEAVEHLQKGARLQLKEEQSEMRWDIVDQIHQEATEEESQLDTVQKVECVLSVIDRRCSEAIPIKGTSGFDKPIKINGFNFRRGAFDGDIVEVALLTPEPSGREAKGTIPREPSEATKTPSNEPSDDMNNYHYGRVVKVIKPIHQTKYVCTADKFNSINFYPLDKSVPPILNLPKVSKNISTKNLQIHSKEFIAVFKVKADDEVPQIKELVPHSSCEDLLFVVKILGWSPKYRKPLGAVIEVLPRSSHPFYTQRLLKTAYDIDDDGNDDNIDDIPPVVVADDGSIPHYTQAITIDPPEAINLDDALSLVPIPGEKNKYKLAVLISNVAKYITESVSINEVAMNRGTSVYGGPTARHMLPSALSSQFSLDYNTSRDVLCVTGTVVMDDRGEVIEVKCDVDESGPEKARMTSIARLTYKSAQNLLDDIPPQEDDGKTQYDATNTSLLRDTLKRLLKIANKLLQGRLGEGVVHDLSNDDDEEQVEEWEAHFLVSELMIWANSNIARYLLNNIPDIALLRRQPSPLPEELQSFMTTFRSILPYSVSLSRHCQSPDTTSNLAIPESLIEKFAKFHGSDKHKLLMHAFMNDSFYPQLATAASAMIKISRPAEYLPAANSDPDTIKHYSLQLIYTHFTSPIRRYFDILVQRLVISLLDGADISYRLDDLKLLCHRLNHRTKMAKRFERDVKKIDTARECEVTLLKTEAFITKSFPPRNHNEYFLSLPSSKFHHIHPNDMKFNANHLNIVPGKQQEEDYATWHVTMAVLDCDHNPLTGLIDATSVDSSTDKIYSINIDYYDGNLKRNCCRTLFKVATQEVNLDVWRKVHDYVKSPNSHSINDLMEQLPKPQSIAPSASIDNPFTSHPVVRCEVKRPLRECEVVNVWLGKSVKQPLPAPSVCLVEVAPGVCTCVQHVQNGPQCFSDPQLEKCSRDIYNNIEEYVELWSKVLIAEAANDSVSESSRNILLIKNVILEWPRLAIGSCIDDVHHSPVDNGVVQLTVPSDVLNYIKMGIGDMICVRYQIDTPQREAVAAVYHFVVTSRYKKKERQTNIEEEEEKAKNVIFKMKAMNNNCLVSEKMKEYLKGPCDMEVIQMPVSFNRVFKRLRQGLNEREEEGEGGDGRPSRQSIDNDRSKKTWSNLSISIAVDSEKLKSTRAISTSLDVRQLENDPFALKLWDVKKRLNDKQIEAVKLAITNKFQLIQGPPGTGKSVVGAHLVYIFAKLINGGDKSVIYCCPSNKAVDVVHKKLLVLNKSAGASNRLRIIRLYGRKHENMDFPEPKEFNTDNGGSVEGRCLDEYKNDALHYLIREKNPRIEEKRKKLSDMNKKGYLPTPEEKQFYNELIKDAEKKVLSQKFDVILCTCNETSSGRLLNIRDKISQCIVDECGMASEPETIAAASLCDHVILIGDHKQLQPVIKYTPARECGLSVSLFERYAERPDSVMEGDKLSTLLIRLDVQYRMHASVCRAPSEMFYDGELITDISVTNRRPIIDERYWSSPSNGYSSRYGHVKLFDIVHDKPTTGSQYHTGRFNINSHCNETEAIKVLEEVKEMRKLGVASTRIAILTPYAGQKDLMKRMIENDKDLKDYKPEVHTIVESQGDEYDIVILTTVRSLPLNQIKHKRLVQPDNRWMRENLGFLTDEHQLNVGITRARHGLIIIGNVTLLKYDPKWRELIMKIS
jgi:superfamily I DNA and/or RNA helicase/exoribonuclease R